MREFDSELIQSDLRDFRNVFEKHGSREKPQRNLETINVHSTPGPEGLTGGG